MVEAFLLYLKSFLTAETAIQLQHYSLTHTEHMEIVRKCISVYSNVELCGRYNLTAFKETGVQDYAIEMFTWGIW